MLGRTGNYLLCISSIVLLSACADMSKKVVEVPVPVSLDSMLAQATAASSSGQPEKALTQLQAAKSAYPADKKPWLQMAQINFDRSNYGQAIIDAQEVLQRDPSDKLANSIVAVSGLRLSTKALADLSKQNNLSGSVRTEAQDLAKLLRESLGESVLVPVVPKPAPVVKRTVPAKPEAVAAKPVAVEVKKADSNPFSSLK
ncbi:tetratricopeptide repeat protein [Undibacterium sp. Ren11W]|uniref:tetratricopeptide repeat protein n=1 Tax=Undibacterium sp. Ren11W TaxID=3413045 RepID=UPI003BF22DFF